MVYSNFSILALHGEPSVGHINLLNRIGVGFRLQHPVTPTARDEVADA
jgi:hypothetical protein